MSYPDYPSATLASTAEPASPIDHIEGSLRDLAQRIVSCRSRLGMVADRVAGPRPETVGNDANSEPDCLIACGNDANSEPYCLIAWVEALHREVSLLESQVGRLS